MRIDDFNFNLPEHLIALRPAEPRGSARMLHVSPSVLPGLQPALTDLMVADLPRLLRRGDLLVLNDTRVLPAQLLAVRPARDDDSAAVAIGLTLHQRLADGCWRAFAKPARRLRRGDIVSIKGAGAVRIAIQEKLDGGEVIIAPATAGMTLEDMMHAHGHMPLPPYITGRRPVDDRDGTDYQTVFARQGGAVAAPTAGLHITSAMLEELAQAGIGHAFVTLHVGAGTFLPVKVSDTGEHLMHSEWGHISAAAAARINDARQAGGRIVSCGTTALRLLETATGHDGIIHPFQGKTDIFITPGYRFTGVDMLMTNFHLPQTTLFMLVCAFSGTETMKAAYAHAVARNYRFFSYGDSSLLERAP